MLVRIADVNGVPIAQFDTYCPGEPPITPAKYDRAINSLNRHLHVGVKDPRRINITLEIT